VLFKTFKYLVYLPVVFIIYRLLSHRYRWAFMLLASCLFYIFFIPYYILILVLTITVDYFAAILIDRTNEKRIKKRYLIFSIISTCAILFFKYFNFFDITVANIARVFNLSYSPTLLNIVLPIGLSFHTFQRINYVIEVYRGNQKPEKHFGKYSLYIMFFPQLVAGPIERSQNLLAQLQEIMKFNLS
jgi:alginate O-acetyltransferase complex protein AlgI